MKEEWKLFRNSIYVSNLGNLKGLDGKPRLATRKNDGYYIFHQSNLKKMFRLHRVVAELFIPNPNNFPCINHKDGDKSNNTVDNLEWCSYSDNLQHAYNSGLHINHIGAGERNPHSKLTQQDVLDIRTKYKHLSGVELGRKYNVHRNTIYEIRKGNTWK